MLPSCMEAAHDDLNTGVEELSTDVDRAGELVRLYADKADHGAVRLFQAADHIDIDLYVVAERLPPAAVVDQVIDGCKGI